MRYAEIIDNQIKSFYIVLMRDIKSKSLMQLSKQSGITYQTLTNMAKAYEETDDVTYPVAWLTIKRMLRYLDKYEAKKDTFPTASVVDYVESAAYELISLDKHYLRGDVLEEYGINNISFSRLRSRLNKGVPKDELLDTYPLEPIRMLLNLYASNAYNERWLYSKDPEKFEEESKSTYRELFDLAQKYGSQAVVNITDITPDEAHKLFDSPDRTRYSKLKLDQIVRLHEVSYQLQEERDKEKAKKKSKDSAKA
ncbi:hypothetical protein JOC36_001522 [Weissella uvarum]|uniref:hypothetical protein n=1 Tax=Weissella uvarum TaxID=1479233 RepID=UPI001960767F|nr:hypothetical protein [Weissella uvarum]MBM7617929.1 hypothetical protein [Weissella uvarum]MCM0596075.1 hypothetical protein [Weissella uvarum]